MKESIVFVEGELVEAHPDMDFVAIEFKSGNTFYSFCLPTELAIKFFDDLSPIIKKAKDKKKDATSNMETSSRATD